MTSGSFTMMQAGSFEEEELGEGEKENCGNHLPLVKCQKSRD